MTTAVDGATAPSPWFSADQQPALRDFYSVFEARDAAIQAETLRAFAASHAFGPMLDASTPERVAAQNAVRREAMLRASAGDWRPYEAYARSIGAAFARSGIGFATWYDAVASGKRGLMPHLFAAFAGDPPRLLAVTDVMHQFFDRLMAAVGEEYLRVRDAMARESDDARRRAEARFARLSEAGLLGIIVTDADGAVLEINDALLAMVGYARADVVEGRVAWRDLTPPEFGDVDARAVEQLRTTGVAELREKEYVHADGHRVPVLAGSAQLEGSRESISFVLDLTERRRAEATIEQLRVERVAEAKFRGLLEASPDPMVIVGTDGRIVLVTAQTERMFGYAREELVGRQVEVLMPEASREDLRVRRARYYAAPDPDALGPAVELIGLRKDGSEMPIEIRRAPLETEEGTLVIAAVRDITARKTIENALALAYRELESFSYSVAHDLRAPLRAMGGFAQHLLDGYAAKLDDEGRDWLGEIQLNAQRMSALIDALLSLARVSRSAMSPERVDLTALARDVAADLAEQEPERVVELVVADGLSADLDPRLARALVENLLGNAWKFTRRTASPRVEVGVGAGPGRRAFFVRDNGAGFDMAYAESLFAPFRRLHTVAEFPGTGIGLATVLRIVHRHGGRVWAEGHVGRGATFYFELDPARAEAAP